MPPEPAAFIRANTALAAPPHVPEIRLHLASEAHALWLKTEEEMAEAGLPPPFWAFAWAGGQGLARYILDNPESVAGKRVLDFASGSGLVGIAAMLAGAASVEAADIDPFSCAAIALNSAENQVALAVNGGDLTGRDHGWDVVLAGDIFYQKDIAEANIGWFSQLAARGALVLIGDPGRAYLPKSRLAALAEYRVPVTRDLEDADIKKTLVYRFG